MKLGTHDPGADAHGHVWLHADLQTDKNPDKRRSSHASPHGALGLRTAIPYTKRCALMQPYT